VTKEMTRKLSQLTQCSVLDSK